MDVFCKERCCMGGYPWLGGNWHIRDVVNPDQILACDGGRGWGHQGHGGEGEVEAGGRGEGGRGRGCLQVLGGLRCKSQLQWRSRSKS